MVPFAVNSEGVYAGEISKFGVPFSVDLTHDPKNLKIERNLMKEQQKIDVAIFRFGIIQDFINCPNLIHGERERLLQEKCDRKWHIPHSDRSSIGRSTILRWLDLYKESGGDLKSLYPKERNDKGTFRALDPDTCQSLKHLRKEMPDTTVSFLLKTMEEREKRPLGLSPSTVYRFFNKNDLMRPMHSQEDRRKFEAEHPNDMWQSDVMHGPHLEINGKQRKSYLIALIDDHSRLIVHGGFDSSETTAAFMDAFKKALLKRGMPRKLYVDNGSAFRSRQLRHTTASLGIALCHARPYKPQGKGKIERFFGTVRSRFLPGFSGNTLEEINHAFEAWLSSEYNERKHSTTGQAPLKRFAAGIECVRSTPNDLKDHFRKKVRRRVNKDRTIILDKHLYEGPVSLIGKQVELLYHENEYDRVELQYRNQSYGFLNEVDPHVNYRVKRDKNNDPVILNDTTTPPSGQMWEGGS